MHEAHERKFSSKKEDGVDSNTNEETKQRDYETVYLDECVEAKQIICMHFVHCLSHHYISIDVH